MTSNKFNLISYASGLGGVDLRCGEGPLVIKRVIHATEVSWDEPIFPPIPLSLRIDEAVKQMCETLAKKVSAMVMRKQFVTVLGGDHTAAIGTWSGVYDALHAQGDIGLLWIDAHMDSHTPKTTESGRLHGMPLATLMGYGYPSLTTILHSSPKIKPEHLCLIGVRSYERSEAELLKRLNVRIYFMDEIKARGFQTIFKEAIEIVCQYTIGYGISLDLDSIDPKEAPAVDVPAPNGLHAKDLMSEIIATMCDPKLVAMEIVEFDPSRDINDKTQKLIVDLMNAMIKKRFHAKT
ncbi:MAG: hypothetical protein A3F42_02910 [Gammaproteobacteria bacterium RIFCSPHIGHO2_12_FULL_37_34]|nr:MAG: hypothetical protein A3F42_02910 [Gammaproteobacteria bacterium RIFCSPHIGHO2_12_FULL_37_34]